MYKKYCLLFATVLLTNNYLFSQCMSKEDTIVLTCYEVINHYSKGSGYVRHGYAKNDSQWVLSRQMKWLLTNRYESIFDRLILIDLPQVIDSTKIEEVVLTRNKMRQADVMYRTNNMLLARLQDDSTLVLIKVDSLSMLQELKVIKDNDVFCLENKYIDKLDYPINLTMEVFDDEPLMVYYTDSNIYVYLNYLPTYSDESFFLIEGARAHCKIIIERKTNIKYLGIISPLLSGKEKENIRTLPKNVW